MRGERGAVALTETCIHMGSSRNASGKAQRERRSEKERERGREREREQTDMRKMRES